MSDGNKKPNVTCDNVPVCLCKQVMHRDGVQPVWGYNSTRREYVLYCPLCSMHTYPSTNRQSVIAEWCGLNRPGDQHIEQLWVVKYGHQQSTAV